MNSFDTFSKEIQDQINTTHLKGHKLLASLGTSTMVLSDKFKFHCYNLTRQAISRQGYKLIQDAVICPIQDDSSILVGVNDANDVSFSVIWENTFVGSFSLRELVDTEHGVFIHETWDAEDSSSLFKQVSDIINKKTEADMDRFYKAFEFNE